MARQSKSRGNDAGIAELARTSKSGNSVDPTAIHCLTASDDVTIGTELKPAAFPPGLYYPCCCKTLLGTGLHFQKKGAGASQQSDSS